jgi:dTDP-4-dehydrorhamnose 3,5-epimerase
VFGSVRKNHRQLWIPEGFAHVFYTISDVAEVIYKVPRYYDSASERSILWNDPHPQHRLAL